MEKTTVEKRKLKETDKVVLEEVMSYETYLDLKAIFRISNHDTMEDFFKCIIEEIKEEEFKAEDMVAFNVVRNSLKE